MVALSRYGERGLRGRSRIPRPRARRSEPPRTREASPTFGVFRGLLVGLTLMGAFWVAVVMAMFWLLDRISPLPI
jgi:uncharacterized RDD family membrane protein YckC